MMIMGVLYECYGWVGGTMDTWMKSKGVREVGGKMNGWIWKIDGMLIEDDFPSTQIQKSPRVAILQ